MVCLMAVGIARTGTSDATNLRRAARDDESGGGMVDRQYYVYILTTRHHTVLYTGVTNDL